MERITIGVLAERILQHTDRVNEAFERGTARMDRESAATIKALADLRKEAKDDIAKIGDDVKALRKEIEGLTRLRDNAQGWLGGILFVAAMFGGGVGALIKTLLGQGD